MIKLKLPYLITFILLIFVDQVVYSQGKLNEGTIVVVKPSRNWDSREKIAPVFIVKYPVKDKSGNVIINEGMPVEIYADWKKNKGVGKPGKVVVDFQSVKGVDGSLIIASAGS